MRIVRFLENNQAVLGVWGEDNKVTEISSLFNGSTDLIAIHKEAKAEGKKTSEYIVEKMNGKETAVYSYENLELLTPVEAPEVWACGVTYERSRVARNYETSQKDEELTFYDKVYDAVRPEIFFKSTAQRTIRPNQSLNIRSDSNWQIPEPELVLVLTEEGEVVGYTAGNDMSSRDIEGENPLYLPQAKVWKGSTSFGPAVRLADTVENPYNFHIICRIYRNDEKVFEGDALTSQLKRKYDELIHFFKLDNDVFAGTALFTGTCIVPPNDFTLQEGDRVDIEIEGIGVLSNKIHQL